MLSKALCRLRDPISVFYMSNIYMISNTLHKLRIQLQALALDDVEECQRERVSAGKKPITVLYCIVLHLLRFPTDYSNHLTYI